MIKGFAMWHSIKAKKLYFILLSLVILSGLFLLVSFTKEEIFLFVNRNNSKFLDSLFGYGTDLGKGTIYIAAIIVTLFIKYRYALTVCLATIIETIMVQVPKRLLFPDVVRPIKYFDGFQNLHIVEHIKIHSHYSVPSGHTAVAFCVFTLMALFVKRKQMELPFLFLAMFVGYSRIYLVQHFFLDVYFGVLIGVFSALFSFWLININQFRHILNQGWLDRNLVGNKFLKSFIKRT